MQNVPSFKLRLTTRNYKAAIIISARLSDRTAVDQRIDAMPGNSTKTSGKGRAAYRKFMGECVKKTPAQAGGDNRGQSIRHGWAQPSARPSSTRHALLKIPRASARGRGYESVGKCFAAARYGTLPFPHLHCPPSGDREARPLSRRRPLSSTGAGDFEVRARRALTALRLPPARLTQSSTSFEIED